MDMPNPIRTEQETASVATWSKTFILQMRNSRVKEIKWHLSWQLWEKSPSPFYCNICPSFLTQHAYIPIALRAELLGPA